MASKWNASKNAYNENKNYNRNKATSEYGSDVASLLDNWYATNNPISKYYFRNDDRNKEYNNFIKDTTNDQIKQMQNYLDNTFGTNWDRNYAKNFNSTDLSQNFLDNQYNNALEQLDRALKRGTLSNSGYQSALNNLNTQRSGANVMVNDLAKGIVDNNIADMRNLYEGYGADVSNYDLGKAKTTNIDVFKSGYNDLMNEQMNNFGDQFALATQNYNPFDMSDIIGNARVQQGVNNIQSDELLGAIEDTEKKKDKKVGLGNKGLF